MTTRRERVIVEAVDEFSSPMARMAASAKFFENSLDSIDGKTVRTNRGLSETAVQTDRLGASMRSNGAEIDKFSGRLRLFADLAAVLGPGLVPIGAVAIPAVTALAGQLGFAAIGAGSLITAFQGVGDALTAVNDAALEPTAANLEKAREAMSHLGPEAQEFVTRFQEIRPVLADMRDSAAAGWFPGLTESLDSLVEVGPKVGEILRVIGESGGNLLAEGAERLAGPEWAEFLTFVQNTAPAALETLGRTIGNVATGLAELWMAFDPINTDVNDWLLESSRSFAEWADGLSETQGFQDFVAYLRESGPQVADALGSIGNALLQIVEAAAPLGGPVLAALTAVADALAAIADSQAGPALLAAASAMAILNRAQLGMAAIGKTAWATNISGARGFTVQAGQLSKTLAGAAAGITAFGFAQSGLAEDTGLSNAAMGTMAGSITGPYGAAIGAGIGFVLDFKAAQDDLADATRNAFDALNSGDITAMKANLKALADIRYDPSIADIGGSFIEDPTGFLGSLISGDASDVLPGGFVAQTVIKALQDEINRFDVSHIGGQIGALGGAMDAAAAEAEEFAATFRDVQTALDLSGSIGAYEASLDNLTASIKENGDQWDQSGPKGRANMEQARENVDKTILRFQALTEAGKDFAAQRFMDRAIRELEGLASQSDAAEAALRPLIRALREADGQNVSPQVKLQGLGAAIGQLGGLLGTLKKVDGADANPSVKIEGLGSAIGGLGSLLGSLQTVDGFTANATVNVTRTGGDIPGVNVATGGYISGPGTSTSDSIPAMLSTGEFVMNAKAVQHYGLDAMFRMNARHLRDGGSASGIGSASSAGIGSASALDISPFAASLHNLTQIAAEEFDIRARDLDRTDEQFKKILDKRSERAQKEADADKAKLDAMLDVQKQFEEQVAGLFKSDVFAAGESMAYAVFPDGSMINLGKDIGSLTPEDYLDYQSQGATIQSQSDFDPIGGLQSDIGQIQEAMRLYQELRARGFDGPAFRDLAASADVATLQEMAAMTNAELAQTERLFEQRDQLAGQAGQVAGRDLNSEIRELRKDYKESLAVTRDLKQELKQLNARTAAGNADLKNLDDTGPARIAAGVGEVIQGAVNSAAGGRGGGGSLSSGLNSSGHTPIPSGGGNR